MRPGLGLGIARLVADQIRSDSYLSCLDRYVRQKRWINRQPGRQLLAYAILFAIFSGPNCPFLAPVLIE